MQLAWLDFACLGSCLLHTTQQPHNLRQTRPSQKAVDLVSYVEFQNNYRALLEYHRAALEANREFWRLVMRDTVPVMAKGSRWRAALRVQSPVPHGAALNPAYCSGNHSPAASAPNIPPTPTAVVHVPQLCCD